VEGEAGQKFKNEEGALGSWLLFIRRLGDGGDVIYTGVDARTVHM